MKKEYVYGYLISYAIILILEIQLLPSNIISFLRESLSHYVFWFFLNVIIVLIIYLLIILLLFVIRYLLTIIVIQMYSRTKKQFFLNLLFLDVKTTLFIEGGLFDVGEDRYAILKVKSLLRGGYIYSIGCSNLEKIENLMPYYLTQRSAIKKIQLIKKEEEKND